MGSLWFLCQRLGAFSGLLIMGMSWYAEVEAASLRLSWTDVSNNENGFKIERMSSNGTFVQVATVGANTQSYTDSGLTTGVSYCYVVRAFNSAGTSDPSNGACATAKDVSSSSISSSTTTTSTSGSGSATTLTLPSSGSSSSSTSSTSSSTSPTVSNTLPAVSYIGGRWGDYRATLKMKSMDDDTIGVMFRYQDQNNYYRFSWARDPARLSRRLGKQENGVFTVLAEDKVPYVIGRTYQLEIVVQGTTIKISIDGSLIFSVTDSSFDGGTIALYSSLNQGSIFDDIVVEEVATGNLLLSENFNDGNFKGWTVIDDKGMTVEGPSVWSAQSGALVQSTNIGSNVSNLGTFALYTKGSWTDYQVTMKLTSMDDDTIGVMFRYQEQNNYYRFSWARDPARLSRRLGKQENGVFTVLAEDKVPYVIGRTYQLEIVVQGTTIKISIDGSLIFSVTDSSFDGGTIALYSSLNQGSIFDDIVVEEVATGNLLLSENFNDGNFKGWTVINDKGMTVEGPSAWSAQSGTLVQSTNIGSNVSNLGTFALY